MAAHATTDPEPYYTDAEKEWIREELSRMLETPFFSSSKRFSNFLRFVIREVLEGRSGELKERTLGIAVFGRSLDYETTTDPIVRVTATKLRKRLLDYHSEIGSTGRVKISLPAGSYVPQFEWLAEVDSTVLPDLADARAEVPGLHPEATRPSTNLLPRLAVLMVVVLALCAAGFTAWRRAKTGPLDRFWSPLLASGQTVGVCFPQTNGGLTRLHNAGDLMQARRSEEPLSGIVSGDLQAVVGLSGLLETRHVPYRLMGADEATLGDLRRGPTVFIGAFDNLWTLRLTRNLRYRFGNDPQIRNFWIEDTMGPKQQRWSIDMNQVIATNSYQDYAIVGRFKDPDTGEQTIVAAGVSRGGTIAASEFLDQPASLDAIKAQMPPNDKNVEFVLSTNIVDGHSSVPKVEAVYIW